MNTEDLNQLAITMKNTAKLYPTEVDSPLVDIYFDLLIEYPIDEVTRAFKHHIKHGAKKDFFPKPGNIIDIIEGKEVDIKPDDLVALALAKKTPLGVLAAAWIGSFDLGNGNTIYLRGRAKEFLTELDMIIHRSNHGTFTPWELNLLKKYNIDPFAPLAPGFPKPEPKPNLKLISKNNNGKNNDDFDNDIPI